jgi:hypothetical protein
VGGRGATGRRSGAPCLGDDRSLVGLHSRDPAIHFGQAFVDGLQRLRYAVLKLEQTLDAVNKLPERGDAWYGYGSFSGGADLPQCRFDLIGAPVDPA